MKKHYSVQMVGLSRFQAISFSLDSARPETYFGRLEKDLKKLGVKGPVLMDLVACNGMTSRRFFSVVFDGDNLDLRTFRAERAAQLDPQSVEACTQFYAHRANNLNSSVLSAAGRYKLSAPHAAT